MSRARRGHVAWAAFALLTAALAVAAAGCGGSSKSSSSTGGKSSSNLPSSIGKGEGALNLIEWPYYSDKSFAAKFEKQTGCKIHRKDAGSSNQMVALMRAGGGGGGGQWDLVSASGDASLRLIRGGDVQEVNVDLIPSWRNFIPIFKSPAHNTVDGKHYGVSVQWGPNVLLYNATKVKPGPTDWNALYDAKHKGQITVPNNPIQIADAAFYLMHSKPDLGIKDPYELNKKQFDATIALLKQQRQALLELRHGRPRRVRERRRLARGDLARRHPRAPGEEGAGEGGNPLRGRNGVGRHVDARQEGAAPELRVPVDEVRDDSAGRGAAGACVRGDARQPEGVPVHGQDPGRLVREIPPERAAELLRHDQVLEDADRRLRQRQQRLHGLQRLAESVDAGHRLTDG